MVKPKKQDVVPSDHGNEATSSDRSTATPQDLRKHLRFQIDESSTSFSIKGVSTSLGSGRVTRGRAAINLSEGGTMLLVCEPIPVGTPIVVRIEIDERKEFIETTGVVKWCERDGRNEKDFHAGIEFVGLSEADLRKIAKMREWFTSDEYRNSRATQRRE
jgi:hypothetical protein